MLTSLTHTHSSKLERWLGKEAVEHLSSLHRTFPVPVAVAGVPGNVYVMPGGDFCGGINGGEEVSAIDRADQALKKHKRLMRLRNATARRQAGAFGNLGAVIAAMTGGKAQYFNFSKGGVTPTATGTCVDHWTISGGLPAAGSIGGAAPTGTSFTNSTTGAFKFINPSSANTAHFVNGAAHGSAATCIMLTDRLFGVAKTMNSTATEAVTGTFSRYQNTTAGTEDYVGGNFCYPRVGTGLPATAHNWTVCQYTAQDGTTGQSFGSVAGVSSAFTSNFDLPAGTWFLPFAAGDVGVKALTQMQCSALVASGTIEFVVAHPIAQMPCPVANTLCMVDGINTAMSLVRVYDNACLSYIEFCKPTSGAATVNGFFTLVSE